MSIKLVTVGGSVRWEKNITLDKHAKLAHVYPYKSNLYYLTNLTKTSKAQDKIVILDGKTGEEKQKISFTNKGELIAVDNTFFGPDSTFYFVGRSFPGARKISDKTTGVPYLNYLDNTTGSLHKIPMPKSLGEIKFFWMDIVTTPDNQKFLIGESFKSESYGAYLSKALATGILTLGMLSVTWSNLKFNDVLVLPLSQQPLPPPLTLSISPRTVTLGSHLNAYQFVRYAIYTGQVRYFGHDKKGDLYLLEKGMLQKYYLDRNNLQTIGALPDADSRLVLYTCDEYMIFFNQRKLSNLAEFRIFPLIPF